MPETSDWDQHAMVWRFEGQPGEAQWSPMVHEGTLRSVVPYLRADGADLWRYTVYRTETGELANASRLLADAADAGI